MEDHEAGSGSFSLGQDDSRYISQVLRMREGEQLTIVLKDGIEALCEVSTITKNEVTEDDRVRAAR